MLRLLLVSPVGLAVFFVLRALGHLPGGALTGPHPPAPSPTCIVTPRLAEVPSVTGEALAPCPSPHTTGFHRDGYCRTGPADRGLHAVCAHVTDEFLAFTRARGNDLSTPRPGFPGLQAGDGWCLCADRWREALEAGVAPPVELNATEASALSRVPRAALEAHAMHP